MKSLFQSHAERWTNCRRCPLCETRTNVVLARGTIPADVLLIGEAPGSNEDSIGAPFVGPAGQVLDSILARIEWGSLRYAITNIVACLPVNEDGEKGAPELEEIEACRPRLQEMIDICAPKLVVFVGKTAKDWGMPDYKNAPKYPAGCRFVAVEHPAFLLRLNSSQMIAAKQRIASVIATAIGEIEDC